MSSLPLRRVAPGIARRSIRIAFFCRRSGMPPNCATSGFLPVLWTLTWKHRRRPYGVTTVVRYVRAIAVTVERCLAASVLSIEVNMTQCSRFSRHTSPASK